MRKLAYLLIIVLVVAPVIADDDGFGREDEAGEEISETFANLAVIMLLLGSSYVVLRRGYVLSRKLGDDRKELKAQVLTLYRKSRKPLLIFHNITLIIATVAGTIHGIFAENEGEGNTITGIIAASIMGILSISGLIMYYRFSPIWDNRPTRGFVRFLHRQWILTGILIIFLLIHV